MFTEAPLSVLAFSQFRLDLARAELSRGGAIVPLRPKALSLLIYLATHPGRVLNKRELLAGIWPDVVVTDDSLSQCVVELRSALGDVDQSIVRTVPRLGYRFEPEVLVHDRLPEPEPVVPDSTPVEPANRRRGYARFISVGVAAAFTVGLIAAGRAALHPAEVDSALAARRSVTVVPFADFGDPPTPHWVDALTAGIVTDLGHLRDTTVVSGARSTPVSIGGVDAKEIGRRLGVRHVLTGSVTRTGSHVQIRVQLTRTDTAELEWVQMLEQADAAGSSWQDVSQQITAMLDSRLLEGDVHADPRDVRINAAADEWSSGVYLMQRLSSRANLLEARRHFGAALDLDPRSINALSGMAGTYLEEVVFRWSVDRSESLRAAREFALRAMAIDADHPESLRILGNAYMFAGRFEEAEPVFRKAVEIAPGTAVAQRDMASLMLFTGRFAEAAPYARAALKLDPRSASSVWKCHAILAQSLMAQGRGGEGLDELRQADLASPASPKMQYMIAAAEANVGRLDEARRDLAEIVQRHPGETISTVRASASSHHPLYVSRMQWLYDGLRLAGLPEGQ